MEQSNCNKQERERCKRNKLMDCHLQALPCPRCQNHLTCGTVPLTDHTPEGCSFCGYNLQAHEEVLKCSVCNIVLCFSEFASDAPEDTKCCDKFHFLDLWRLELYHSTTTIHRLQDAKTIPLTKHIRIQSCWAWCVMHDMVFNPHRCLDELRSCLLEGNQQNPFQLNSQVALNVVFLVVKSFVWQEDRVPNMVRDWILKVIKQSTEVAYYSLRLVTMYGSTDTFLEFLLSQCSVDPSAVFNCNIAMASRYGQVNVVKRLLRDERVDPSADDNIAITMASRFGHMDVVAHLIADPRVDPSVDHNAAIRWASSNGHVRIVNRLLSDTRVDPSALRNQALRFACSNGFYHVLERLLQDERVDPSSDDNFAIISASENGHAKIVNRLLQHKNVDPSTCRNSALRRAIANGHVRVVERLLQDERVDPSVENYEAFIVAGIKSKQLMFSILKPHICYNVCSELLLTSLRFFDTQSKVLGTWCLVHGVPFQIPDVLIFEIVVEWSKI